MAANPFGVPPGPVSGRKAARRTWIMRRMYGREELVKTE
jgi:hypothetical protein